MHGHIRSHWSAKEHVHSDWVHICIRSIVSLCYVSWYSIIYIYILYVYLYTIIVFFQEAGQSIVTLTFSRACKYRNLLQHCSEDCAVHQPKESKQRIQPQHVPSTSATTYHQPPKKKRQLLRSKHWTEEHSHFGIQFLQNSKYPVKWYEFGITKHPADNPCEWLPCFPSRLKSIEILPHSKEGEPPPRLT